MKKNKKIGRAVCAADLGSGWERGFVLRKALCFLLECLSRRFFAEYGPKVSKGRAESPLVRPQAHNPRHPAGPDAPTPARGQGLQPYGALYASGGGPKGCRGERRETGIQWIQPPKAVSARSFRQTTSGAHGSAGRADCLPRGKPPVCPQAYTLSYWYADSPKGVQGGNGGKRVSSGYNRRRRLAPRSSGKQQAGRTAVRTAPIVCPEESPQCARRRKPLPDGA